MTTCATSSSSCATSPGAPVPLYDPSFPDQYLAAARRRGFQLPAEFSIPANGHLLVVSFDPTNTAQLAAFGPDTASPRADHPGSLWWQARQQLRQCRTLQPDPPQQPPSPQVGFVPYVLADKVKYSDSPPWPSLADGNTNGVGYSLQRRVGSDYGNDPVNWLAGGPTPGAASGPAALLLPSIPRNLRVRLGPKGTASRSP